MKVTQAHIAKQVGVSRQLVSFALNGVTSEVSPEMRDKIIQTAQRLGYSSHSNQAARSLAARRNRKSSKTGAIALILPQAQGQSIRSIPFFVPWMDGVESAAAQHDLVLCLLYSRPDQPLPRLLRERGVDGMVCADRPDSRLVELDIPIAVLGQSYSGTYGIKIDGRDGIRQAVKHLVGLGHRKIAYLGHKPDFDLGKDRYDGYCEALKEVGLPFDPKLSEATLIHQEEAAGSDAIRRLRARSKQFTAVVCYNDVHAMGAVRGLQALGLSVPGDISVTGFDHVSAQYGFSPALTSLAFDRFKMGQRAVECLVEKVSNPNLTWDSELTPVHLVVGGSTAQAPLEKE